MNSSSVADNVFHDQEITLVVGNSVIDNADGAGLIERGQCVGFAGEPFARGTVGRQALKQLNRDHFPRGFLDRLVYYRLSAPPNFPQKLIAGNQN